jgi:hypothetical protein
MLTVGIFAAAGICLYQASHYARAVPNEKTTTAHVFYVYHSIFRGLRFDYYSCSYDFRVDNSLYFGRRDCPQWIIDQTVKGRFSRAVAAPPGTYASVYYDPADPSFNSLLDFNAQSQVEFKSTVPWVGLAILVILFFALGKLLGGPPITVEQ